MSKKRKNNTESTEDGPLIDRPLIAGLPITGHPNHPAMSAGIKSYQESKRLKSWQKKRDINEEPSAGFTKKKRDVKESDEDLSAVLRAENIGSVKVNPSGLKGLKNQKLMSAGIKSYQESKRLNSRQKKLDINEEPSAGFTNKRDVKESDDDLSAVLRAENIGSVKVNPSGIKGLKNQKLEHKMKDGEANYQESAPKVSIKILGDFKIYERLKYHRPFRVLFDTLFLEGYLLREGNYAVESIQDLVGGPCIFLFTNCVLRNITQKRLGMHLTDLTTEEYHCKDSIDYRRTDFDCLTEVIKEDGINESLILATGDKRLEKLIRKISAVPILYLSNNEKPKSRQGAPDFEVEDEVMPRELLFELHHEKRNIMNMLKEADFNYSASETVKVFLDEGFMLRYYKVFLDEEFIHHISELLGRQVALISTWCASNHKVPSPHIGYVMCGHKKHRPLSDDCVMSVVEKPEYGISYVATMSDLLKDRLSKMRYVTIISFQGSKMITEEDTLTSISKEKGAFKV